MFRKTKWVKMAGDQYPHLKRLEWLSAGCEWTSAAWPPRQLVGKGTKSSSARRTRIVIAEDNERYWNFLSPPGTGRVSGLHGQGWLSGARHDLRHQASWCGARHRHANMDGFAVLTALKANLKFRPVPVMVLTAHNEADDVRQAISLGAKGLHDQAVR